MAYTPDVFADGEAGGTPITAAKLNRLGQGLEATSTVADTATTSVTALDGRLDTVEAAVPTFVTSGDIDTIVQMTQAEYDALATKDARTLYVIV